MLQVLFDGVLFKGLKKGNRLWTKIPQVGFGLSCGEGRAAEETGNVTAAINSSVATKEEKCNINKRRRWLLLWLHAGGEVGADA